MSENPRGVSPLNWDALVAEALRRRRDEKLTQREHAALAGVSIPTMAAFERGETTLTLVKAFDILRVVGLVADDNPHGAQDVFVREAYERWRALTDGLPKASPGRFPHGWYRFDYWLEGEMKAVGLSDYEEILQATVTRHTGWPVFLFLDRSDFFPKETDGTIETWLHPTGDRRADAAHCDFWRAAPEGRLFLMRGYQEDGQETFPPGSLFDTTLPIWRMGEALLHAERLTTLLRKAEDTEVTVHFRAVYTGLSGRVLKSWANPLGNLGLMFEDHAARGDEAVLETVIPADGITGRLAEHLFPMVASLYERFGVTGVPLVWLEAEVRGLLGRRLV